MERMVSVHHVDKDAFLKGNVEHDSKEKVVVFDHSLNYAEGCGKSEDCIELEGPK